MNYWNLGGYFLITVLVASYVGLQAMCVYLLVDMEFYLAIPLYLFVFNILWIMPAVELFSKKEVQK